MAHRLGLFISLTGSLGPTEPAPRHRPRRLPYGTPAVQVDPATTKGCRRRQSRSPVKAWRALHGWACLLPRSVYGSRGLSPRPVGWPKPMPATRRPTPTTAPGPGLSDQAASSAARVRASTDACRCASGAGMIVMTLSSPLNGPIGEPQPE